ncbi:MAG: hypothetical protein H0X66_07040 [Verrucomicrobia bacterium]|nr:hypothetical protein [Verrucomicrobiota bacterium]
MKLRNTLLVISLIGFAVGFSDIQDNMLFWLGRPIGAIFAIVYFLFVFLEKPFAGYDAEQLRPVSNAPAKTSHKEKRNPALTGALS